MHGPLSPLHVDASCDKTNTLAYARCFTTLPLSAYDVIVPSLHTHT